MSNDKKQVKNDPIEKENIIVQDQFVDLEDVENRINDLELGMIDAKEFTHLSSEAFEQLQRQIDELREMFETLLSLKAKPEEKRSIIHSEYI